MHEREYKRLKQQFRADYEEKLRALELIWQASGGAARNGNVPRAAATPSTAPRRGTLLDAIRAATKDMDAKEFTAQQVIQRMRHINPEVAKRLRANYVSMALKRLSEDGEIFLIEVGAGKRPSCYALEKPVVVIK